MITELTKFDTAIKSSNPTLTPDLTAVPDATYTAALIKTHLVDPNGAQFSVATATTPAAYKGYSGPVLGNDAKAIFTAATFDPTAVVTPKTLLADAVQVVKSGNFLPTTATTNTATGALVQYKNFGTDVNSYINKFDAATTVKVTAGSTKNAYTLNVEDAKVGKLTVSESTAGNPYATGSKVGAINEVITFKGIDSDTLTIKSGTTVNNVASPANTESEFGSSVDAVAKTRSVVFTNTNQKITSVQNFASKHSFNEAANGNQTFSDAVSKNYNYTDPSLKIVSSSQAKLIAATNFATGAEALTKHAVVTYSSKSAAGTALDYIVSQAKTANTTGATTTETTVTNVAKFAFVDKTAGFSDFTVNLTNGGNIIHKQVFNDSGAPVNVSNNNNKLVSDTYDVKGLTLTASNADYDLKVAAFADTTAPGSVINVIAPATILNALGAVATGTNGILAAIDNAYDQSFGDSVAFTVADAGAGIVRAYFNADRTQFRGTDDADTITVKAVAGGNVNSGKGNDTVTGNIGNDTLDGSNGNDSLVGGLGDDFLIGGRGADTIDGGDGVDTFQPAAGSLVAGSAADFEGTGTGTVTGLNIDLTKGTASYLFAAAAATNSTVQDTFVNVENIAGSNLNDVIIGNAGDNVLDGGRGSDTLTGGAGNNTFKFSATTEATGDIVTDFRLAGSTNKVDLSAIDANSTTPADDAFALLATGTTAFTAAGQVRYNGATNMLEGNTDANFATVDFSIKLNGVAAIAATDLVL